MKTTIHNYARFYALLKQLPNAHEGAKEDFVFQYTNGRTISLKEMKTAEYEEMCADIQALIASMSAKRDTLDQWRKRVIAVIGEYLRRLKGSECIDEIKAIACRATHYKDFNMIPIARLRDVYNNFLKANKVSENIRELTDVQIRFIASLN